MSYVTSPTPNDVLMGRGAPMIKYIGNVRFRKLVATRKTEYMSTSRHQLKCQIATEIMEEIICQRNGRFLQRIKTAADARRLGVPAGQKAWVVADTDAVIEKIKQALRDKDPTSDSEEEDGANESVSRAQETIVDRSAGRSESERSQSDNRVVGDAASSGAPTVASRAPSAFNRASLPSNSNVLSLSHQLNGIEQQQLAVLALQQLERQRLEAQQHIEQQRLLQEMQLQVLQRQISLGLNQLTGSSMLAPHGPAATTGNMQLSNTAALQPFPDLQNRSLLNALILLSAQSGTQLNSMDVPADVSIQGSQLGDMAGWTSTQQLSTGQLYDSASSNLLRATLTNANSLPMGPNPPNLLDQLRLQANALAMLPAPEQPVPSPTPLTSDWNSTTTATAFSSGTASNGSTTSPSNSDEEDDRKPAARDATSSPVSDSSSSDYPDETRQNKKRRTSDA